MVMGWEDAPPSWLSMMGWSWSGPKVINRYLGIPFSLDPSFADMWDWLFNKINGKHLKWQTHSLSLARRVQVVQKVLSSHHILFASAWLFTKT